MLSICSDSDPETKRDLLLVAHKNVHIIHMVKHLNEHLSPKALADAIGVGESSIKRWADSGKIKLTRTSGGHRRILVKEAIRFIREAGLEVIQHAHLGLIMPRKELSPELPIELLLQEALVQGEQEKINQLVEAIHLKGWSLGEICDGPFAAALARIGRMWLDDSERGILIEHRCTALAISAIERLRSMNETTDTSAPIALGGALSGDQSQLPSLMAAATLEAQGFQAINLGANTPISTFMAGVEMHSPALIWISVNHLESAREAKRAIQDLVYSVRTKGTRVVIGGRSCQKLKLKADRRLFIANSMSDIESFTMGLRALNTAQ
jgi:methanogenic corrinoid protein MtbC1